MVLEPSIAVLSLIGLFAGLISGMFGIGGGIVIIPALIYILGFSQHSATGTSLAILLPPVGLGAVIEYYRQGNVDLRAAIFIALGLFIGAWISAHAAGRISEFSLRLAFGIFVLFLGVSIIYSALKKVPLL